MLRVLLSRVRGTLRRSRLNQELDDELLEHLTMLQERFVRRGMDPTEAFYAARRQFGGVTQVKEELMERRTMSLAEDVTRDVRHTARGLWRSPGFSLTVTLTLALGIGGNTAVFSVVDQLLLRPLPYPDGDQLVMVEESSGGRPADVSPANWLDW